MAQRHPPYEYIALEFVPISNCGQVPGYPVEYVVPARFVLLVEADALSVGDPQLERIDLENFLIGLLQEDTIERDIV